MGSVTDDMTILAVANQRLLCQAVHPTFSIKEWNTERQRVLKMQQEKLHPKTPRVTPPPVSMNKQTAGKQPVTGETSEVRKKADPSASGKHVRNVPPSWDIYGLNTGSQSPQQAKPMRGKYATNDADALEKISLAKRVDNFFDSLEKSLFGVIADEEHTESYTYGYFIDNYSHDSKPKRRNNYCIYCRNKLEGKEKFCPNCGVPIK